MPELNDLSHGEVLRAQTLEKWRNQYFKPVRDFKAPNARPNRSYIIQHNYYAIETTRKYFYSGPNSAPQLA